MILKLSFVRIGLGNGFSELLDRFISSDWLFSFGFFIQLDRFVSSDWYYKHRSDDLDSTAHEHSILSCIYDRIPTKLNQIKPSGLSA
jgi:hypothetical protein